MSSPSQFRSDFPEFADPNAYTDSLITFWMGVGVVLIDSARWGTLTDLGIELCTAHHLVIATKDQNAALLATQTGTNATAGDVSGPATSKSVDRVSVSNDTGATTLSDAGFWNMSTYGIRFLQMARLMGSGPVQLGGYSAPPGTVLGGYYY